MSSTSQRFVRAAYSLLSFQTVVSLGAVAVTGWAAFVVAPSLQQSAPIEESQAPPAQEEAAAVEDDAEGAEANEAPATTNSGPAVLTVAGGNAVGQRVFVRITPDPDGYRSAPSLQWLRDGAPVRGATEPAYVITPDDAGHALSARADYVDGQGNSESVLSATVNIAEATRPVVAACPSSDGGVRVPANAGWCDSGIDVRRGQSLMFTAQGRWSYVGQAMLGPAGSENVRLPNAEAPQANVGALIGRIGEQTFVIGAGTVLTSRVGGRLHLAMNDVPGTYNDNQGVVFVTISEPESR